MYNTNNKYNTYLLNLQDVKITKIIKNDKEIKIKINTEQKEQICPYCSSKTSKIKDYREQIIKDLPIHNLNTYLILNKRRYLCKHCNRTFYEKYSFLPKYFHRTFILTLSIVDSFHDNFNIKQVSNIYNVSTNTVMRILDNVSYSISKVPEVISIDEFKGNAGEKYQYILVDANNHKIYDILKSRSTSYLSSYFFKLPKEERHKVKFFSCDMWKPYASLDKTYFPNAEIVVDSTL